MSRVVSKISKVSTQSLVHKHSNSCSTFKNIRSHESVENAVIMILDLVDLVCVHCPNTLLLAVLVVRCIMWDHGVGGGLGRGRWGRSSVEGC